MRSIWDYIKGRTLRPAPLSTGPVHLYFPEEDRYYPFGTIRFYKIRQQPDGTWAIIAARGRNDGAVPPREVVWIPGFDSREAAELYFDNVFTVVGRWDKIQRGM